MLMEYKEGDEFKVVSGSNETHVFQNGEIVEFIEDFSEGIAWYRNNEGEEQILCDDEVEYIGENQLVIESVSKKEIDNTVPYQKITLKVKEYTQVEDVTMEYKRGDLFKIVSEVKNNNQLQVGQIVELISVGKKWLTVVDEKQEWHYIQKECLEYYDELVHTEITYKVEQEINNIMEFHKQQYIDKCLDEGNFKAIQDMM